MTDPCGSIIREVRNPKPGQLRSQIDTWTCSRPAGHAGPHISASGRRRSEDPDQGTLL